MIIAMATSSFIASIIFTLFTTTRISAASQSTIAGRCDLVPLVFNNGSDIFDEYYGNVTLIGLMDFSCGKDCEEQLRWLQKLPDLVKREGLRDVSFVVFAAADENMQTLVHWSSVLQRNGIRMFQESPKCRLFQFLKVKKRDILIYNRCLKLSFLISWPDSNLSIHNVLSSIRATCNGFDHCECSQEKEERHLPPEMYISPASTLTAEFTFSAKLSSARTRMNPNVRIIVRKRTTTTTLAPLTTTSDMIFKVDDADFITDESPDQTSAIPLVTDAEEVEPDTVGDEDAKRYTAEVPDESTEPAEAGKPVEESAEEPVPKELEIDYNESEEEVEGTEIITTTVLPVIPENFAIISLQTETLPPLPEPNSAPTAPPQPETDFYDEEADYDNAAVNQHGADQTEAPPFVPAQPISEADDEYNDDEDYAADITTTKQAPIGELPVAEARVQINDAAHDYHDGGAPSPGEPHSDPPPSLPNALPLKQAVIRISDQTPQPVTHASDDVVGHAHPGAGFGGGEYYYDYPANPEEQQVQTTHAAPTPVNAIPLPTKPMSTTNPPLTTTTSALRAETGRGSSQKPPRRRPVPVTVTETATVRLTGTAAAWAIATATPTAETKLRTKIDNKINDSYRGDCSEYNDVHCFKESQLQQQQSTNQSHQNSSFQKCCNKGVYLTNSCVPGLCTAKSYSVCCFQKLFQARYRCCHNASTPNKLPQDFNRCCFHNFAIETGDDVCCPGHVAYKLWTEKDSAIPAMCIPNLNFDYRQMTLKGSFRRQKNVHLNLGDFPQLVVSCPYELSRDAFLYLPLLNARLIT